MQNCFTACLIIQLLKKILLLITRCIRILFKPYGENNNPVGVEG